MALRRVQEGSLSNPFAALNSFRREMDRLFSDYSTPGSAWLGAGVFPQVNIYQDKDSFYVTAELPGVEPENVDISLQDNKLILKGERKMATKGADQKYYRRERSSGTFNRVVALPQTMDAGKVKAEYKNGVLTLTLPLAEESKPRQIRVKAE